LSVTKLKQYIERYDKVGRFNYAKFSALIKDLDIGLTVGPSTVIAKKVIGELYEVAFIDEKFEKTLREYAALGDTREALSKQNKSHSTNVGGSMLVVRDNANHPYTVIFDGDGEYVSPSIINHSSTCLIVENLENFLQIEKTLALVAENSTEKFTVVFAGGNAVTNKLHAGYFESFEKVILFLDLDLGGLQIANALKNLVPSVEMTFFMAPNTEQLLSAVIGTQKSNYLEKVIGMAEKQPFLRPACRLIIKHKKVLEQEAYL
jgi:hypothetical protein